MVGAEQAVWNPVLFVVAIIIFVAIPLFRNWKKNKPPKVIYKHTGIFPSEEEIKELEEDLTKYPDLDMQGLINYCAHSHGLPEIKGNYMISFNGELIARTTKE